MFYSVEAEFEMRKEVGEKMQYCRPACVIPMFYDKYLMKIPTGVIEAAI